MSMEAVLHYTKKSRLTGNERVTMLILANYANGDGYAYPGHVTLSKDLALTKSATEKILYRLRDKGELRIETHAGTKTSSGSTNGYWLTKFIEGINDHEGSHARQTLENEGSHARQTHGSHARQTHGSHVRATNTKEDTKGDTKDSFSLQPSASRTLTGFANLNVASVSGNASERELAVTPTPLPPSHGCESLCETGKGKGKAHPHYQAAIDVYTEKMKQYEPGSKINYAREGKGINELLDNGWTPEQIGEAFDKMKQDEFWRSKHLPTQSIATQIGAVVRREPAPAAIDFDRYLLTTYNTTNVMAITNYADDADELLASEYRQFVKTGVKAPQFA